MNHKQRDPMLGVAEWEFVRNVLSVIRKSTDMSDDAKILDDVLEALHECGYVLLPRGVLDNIRKMLK